MSTLLRLLKSVRCYHSSTASLRKKKFENLSIKTLHSQSQQFQTILLTNRLRQHTTLVQSVGQNMEISDVDRKMEQINKEIYHCGIISQFNIENIVNDVKMFGKITNLQSLFLLRSCCELIDNKSPKLKRELGEKIWKTLKELNVPLDVSHYNALLAIYLETEYNFSVSKFLNEMANSNIKPNRVTYQKLIASLCNKGNLIEANKIVEQMTNEQIPVNEHIFSSFIYCYCITNNTEGSVKVIEELKSCNITPTIQTYSSFLYAYAQKGDIENIKKILKNCERNSIWVSSKEFLKIIYYLAVNGFEGHIDEILELTPKSAEYEKEVNKIIYNLVENQKDEIAFKIYQSLPKKKTDQGKFFLQTLINLNIPIEKSIKYCQLMEELGMNKNAVIADIKRSIANDMYRSSITLMKAWSDLGGVIKEDYFYSILKLYAENNDAEGLKKFLEKMILEFNINPSIHMLSTYILPYTSKNVDEAILVLKDFPIENVILCNAILIYLLSQNKIQDAVKFLNLSSLNCKNSLIKTPLLEAFKKTEDVPSFVWILHYLYINSLSENSKSKYNANNFLDSCILDVIDFLAKNKYLSLMFFTNIHQQGLSISTEAAEEILKRLGDNVSWKIVNILKDLQLGERIPKPISRKAYGERHSLIKSMNIDKLENINLDNINLSSVAASCIKIKSLYFYCCTSNEAKVNEILKDFKESNRHISESIYAMLIHMYINLNNIKQAEYWLEEGNKKFQNFRINKTLNLKLISAFVENGQVEKALEQIKLSMNTNVQRSAIRKLLDNVAKYNDENMLQLFFDQLYIHGYILMSPSLMVPFIQLHISRNDGKAAVKKFKWLYYAYGQTPYPTDLMKSLIKVGDFDTLRELTSFCTEKFNETKSYFHLAIAYLESDDLVMAKEIVEKHCFDLSEKLVLFFAEKYYNDGELVNLEKLFEVLNDCKYDVECLCLLLLRSYSLRNDWNKCYKLWIKILKDNIKLPHTFFDFLGIVIKHRNVQNDMSVNKFHTAMQEGNYSKARKILDYLPIIHKSDCYSILCQKYISNKGYYSEALDLWRDLRERFNLNITISSAEYILSKLLAIKDVGSIDKIGFYLSPELKTELNYAYYLNKVHLVSGSYNLYLKQLENQLDKDKINSENLNMHYKTAVYGLLRYPDLYEHFEYLAHKYSKKNIHNLMYVLWAYNFLKKNSKAEELWNYVTDSKLFSELKILHFMQNYYDLSLYVKLCQYVYNSNFDDSGKFIIYTNIIKSCMKSGNPKKFSYSLKCLQQATLDIPMQQFNIDLLVDLQKGLEESGASWPWSVNEQVRCVHKATKDSFL